MGPSLEHKVQQDAEEARVRAMLAVGQPGTMKKRSVVIDGHRTSVSLENVFWSALKLLAVQRGMTVNQIVAQIDRDRDGNLSSAIRVYVLLSHRSSGNGTANAGADTSLTSQALQ